MPSPLFGPDGAPADAPAVLPRAPVIWLGESEGVALIPGQDGVVGRIRILIQDDTDEIPEHHRVPFFPN